MLISTKQLWLCSVIDKWPAAFQFFQSLKNWVVRYSGILGCVASIATSIAAIVAIIQLGLGVRQRKLDSRRKATEAAINIAKAFQGTIICNMSFCIGVLRRVLPQNEIGLTDEQKNIRLQFTRDEFADLSGNTDIIDQYNLRMNSMDTSVFEKVLLKNSNLSSFPIIDNDGRLKEKQLAAFREIRRDLLNTLEWMAMTLVTGVADETVVYQSLHQVFLLYIQIEYPFIAQMNSRGNTCDKYYTNIIELYNLWIERSKHQKKLDIKNKQKYEQRHKQILTRRHRVK